MILDPFDRLNVFRFLRLGQIIQIILDGQSLTLARASMSEGGDAAVPVVVPFP